MNATDVDKAISDLQEEAVRVVNEINRYKRLCTHIYENGTSALMTTASGRSKCNACRGFTAPGVSAT